MFSTVCHFDESTNENLGVTWPSGSSASEAEGGKPSHAPSRSNGFPPSRACTTPGIVSSGHCGVGIGIPTGLISPNKVVQFHSLLLRKGGLHQSENGLVG